jgi:hypothetical protein
MANRTKSGKNKKAKTNKRKARGKKSSLQLGSPFQTIKVHPHFARAIASLKKFSSEELDEIKTLAGTVTAGSGNSTGCWLSDSGGQQHCVNLPPAVCTSKGGISVPTKCPIA